MALFSDLLPYILQQQQTALPGGPNLGPAIPRSPTNVTAMNMPSAKLPGAFDFANTANNFSNVMGENALRQQQAHLSDLQAQHLAFQLKHLPEFWDQYTKTSGNLLTPGAGGSEQGGSLYQGSGTSGRLSPTGGGAGGDSGTYWTPEGLAALRPTEGRYDQIHYPSGNPSTATGAYGFLDSTWQEQAKKAGVDINQYPRAYLAPPEVQDMVAAQTPIHHWTGVDANGKPFNAAAQKLATNPAYVAGGRQTAAVPVTGGETISVPPGPTPAANAPWAPGDMSQYTRPGDKGRPVTVDGVTYPSTSAWNRAMDAQATATAGSAAMPVAPQGGAGIPEVPSYGGAMGETGATPPAAEDNDASLTPGEAGDESPGFAGRALTAKAASPREQLNEQIRARLGERQVAGEGAFGPAGATGNLLPGMNNLTGEVPALPGLDPALSMPFNPAAQQAAGPSPAVPTGGNVPVPTAPTPGGAGPAGMAQALAAAQAATPKGQGAGFQLDPKQAEILKTIIMGNLVGMPNATKPLSEAFYNSPYFAEQKAAASARGAAQVGLQYAFPRKAAEEAAGYLGAGNNPTVQADVARARKVAEEQVALEYQPQIAAAVEMAKSPAGIAGLLAMAAKLPEDSPLRTIYTNAAVNASGIKPTTPPSRETPGQVWDAATNSYRPAPNALPDLEAAQKAVGRGRGAFEPQPFYDARGNVSQGTRAQLENPPVAPTAPGTNFGVGPSLAPPPGASSPGATPAPLPIPPLPQSASAAPPNFILNTPAGPRQAGQTTIADLFPDGQGIPQRPPPLPGMGYGPLSEPEKKQQERDGERLNGYAEEGQANQAIYQNLDHLQKVMQSGLVTGKLEPVWTDMANIAQNLGIKDFAGPGGDPENAALLNKAATRLVFAGLGKLRGQVRNMEITGLGQANPNGTIPMAANVSILNDILSAGKWEDERNRLAHQYWYETGHAPLAAFDAKFNQAAPLVDVTDKYRQTLQAAGMKFPGDRAEDAAMRIPENRTATRIMPDGTKHQIKNQGGILMDLTTGKPLEQ